MGLIDFFKGKSDENRPSTERPPENRDVRFEEQPVPETSTSMIGREPVGTAPDPVPAPDASTEDIVKHAAETNKDAEAEGEDPDPDKASAGPAQPDAAPLDSAELRERIIKAMRTVYDPEIPVNIYDLGLIYSIDINGAHNVHISMTLTAPNCPAAGILPGEVEAKVRTVEGVNDVKLDLVWEPSWNKDMMSEAARLELGF